jgi:hypothetical protein
MPPQQGYGRRLSKHEFVVEGPSRSQVQMDARTGKQPIGRTSAAKARSAVVEPATLHPGIGLGTCASTRSQPLSREILVTGSNETNCHVSQQTC